MDRDKANPPLILIMLEWIVWRYYSTEIPGIAMN
jgi:hypothetical protein